MQQGKDDLRHPLGAVVDSKLARTAADGRLVGGGERRAALHQPRSRVRLKGFVAGVTLAGHVKARHLQVQGAEGVGQVVAVIVGKTGIAQGNNLGATEIYSQLFQNTMQ